MRPPQQLIHIHAEAPLKPAVGQTCNGCGICCLAEPCPVGMLISRKRRGACTALQWSDVQRRYQCGMLVAPLQSLGWRGEHALSRWFAGWLSRRSVRWIAAGKGCDSSLEPLGQATSAEPRSPR